MSAKVMIGMSGGVDSAVAAFLLKSQGYEVTGVTLKLCGGNESDLDDAKAVADKIGIPHVCVDLSCDFEKLVMDDFVECYKNGGTPNPCVTCNKKIKFGKMLDIAMEHGMDYIATGHYAMIEKGEDGCVMLRKAADETKDQSYFLYSLDQSVLKKVIFPLGGFSKQEVRAIAEQHGFINSRKRDSQDICFVPGGDYAEFIEKYTGESFPTGNFVDKNGVVLGEHSGIIKYTIGQRKGLNVGGHKDSIFVISTDIQENIIYVGEGHTHKGLSRSCLRISPEEIHWIRPDLAMTEGEIRRYKVRVRYRQPLQDATVIMRANGMYILFDTPQRGITSGQFAVWYDSDEMIGSGVI